MKDETIISHERQYRVRIIGVLDLMDGRAVHAKGGRRETYLPVACIAGRTVSDGDSLTVARAYREVGVDELYVADLDAIAGRALQHERIAAIAAEAPVWLDAGVASRESATRALDAGAARVIVGLETLPSFDTLADICEALGSDRVVFSLDLRGGTPMASPAGALASLSAGEIAACAAAAGVRTMIVLDVARVGTGSGPDLEQLGSLRAASGMHLIAGGGIRGLDDLTCVAGCGCDGALVATAIHDGRLTAVDITAARQLAPTVSR